MQDSQLLKELAFKLLSRNTRIKDLEVETARLKVNLEYAVEALSKADNKLIEIQGCALCSNPAAWVDKWEGICPRCKADLKERKS